MCQVGFLMLVIFLFLFFFLLFVFFHYLFLLFQLNKCYTKKKKDEMPELMKNALIAATKYLQKNMPLKSTLLKDITYLDNPCYCYTCRKVFSCYKKKSEMSLFPSTNAFFINKKSMNTNIVHEWYQDSLTKNFKRLDSYW